MGGGVFRVPDTTGNEGRNVTERTNKPAGSKVTALVLNGHEKTLKSEGMLKGAKFSLQTTEKARKKINGSGCHLKEKMEALVEKFHTNGNGKAKQEFERAHLDMLSQPPVTAEQAADLAHYFYLKKALRLGLEGKEGAEEMKEYMPSLKKVSLAIKGVPQEEKEMATKLAEGVRSEALKAAYGLLPMKRRLKKGLAEADAEEAKLLAAVELSYANRKLSTEERLQKKMMPLEDVLKKVGIPVGAALLVASTREVIKAFIIDVTEHIPLLMPVPPEFIGLGIIGVWALVRFGKWLVDGKVRKTMDALPISKARAEQDAKDAMNGKRDEMEQEFRSDMEARLGMVKVAYEQLLYEHGYAKRG